MDRVAGPAEGSPARLTHQDLGKGDGMTIETEEDLVKAEARIVELAGCLEGTEEERELEALADAVETFRRRHAL